RSMEKALRPKASPIKEDTTVRGIGPNLIKFFKYQIGEPPVLLDTFAIKQDMRSLREICFANGYFSPDISYELDTLGGWLRKQPKVNISYQVKEGIPHRINQIVVEVLDQEDSAAAALVRRVYFQDTSLLGYGSKYNHQRFAQTRVRMTQSLRELAFFTFSQDMIRYGIDSEIPKNNRLPEEGPAEEKWVDVYMEISEVPERYIVREIVVTIKDPGGKDPEAAYHQIRASELSEKAREQLDLPFRKLDSTVAITWKVAPSILDRIHFDFLAERIRLVEKKGLFRSRIQTTRENLQQLGMFQYVLVNPRIVAKERAVVDIELQLAPKYQMKAGAETFTTDVYLNPNLIPNVGANLTFRDKNAFYQSELLQWDVGGSVGWSSLRLGTPDYYQASTEARIQFHKFLFSRPFLFLLPGSIREKGLQAFSPSTQLSASFRVEQTRQRVTQITPGVALSYRWNHIPFSDKAISRMTPLKLEYISPTVSSAADFNQEVEALPELLQRDFSRRISSKLNYSYTHQTYRTTRTHPTYWYRLTIEGGGNMAYLAEQLALSQGWDKDPSDNSIGQIFYGQFVRGGVEGKLFVPTSPRTELVFRGLIGMGTPLFQSPITPKESRYFGGGINGMRAWQSNTLGPGRVGLLGDLGVEDPSLAQLPLNNLIAPGGEYQFEMNAEFRFDVGSYLELALFTDMGNVWMSQRSAEAINSPKAGFSRENLVLGWDAGLGIRFDLSFLILRADWGQMLYHPAYDPGWVIGNATINDQISTSRLNVGIDYPF
ncbi:MAG: BamA/TamA family outer membrane protein, partial [Bacteroidota bacterium]